MVQPFSPNISNPISIFTFKHSSSRTLLFVTILCILAIYTIHHTAIKNTQNRAEYYRHAFLSLATNQTFSSYLKDLTLHPHLAGTNLSLKTAQYVQTHFTQLGLETKMAEFQGLLSYPVHSSLVVRFSTGSVKEMALMEMGMENSGVVMPYHAYSPSGSAYAKVVFVNFGREEDYGALGVLGVKVSGCVVLVRRGEMGRGAVVEKAAEKGAVAVLMYTDGDGNWVNGVERGTVMMGIGDPLSPAWTDVLGGERLEVGDNEVLKRFPRIPSMPISAEIAGTIFRTLEGAPLPPKWKDTLGANVSGVGPGPTMANFTYQGEKNMAAIYNVFAIIRGSEEPERHVLLGNHRDAWTYGAVDPNSGTAALLDIARRYAMMMRSGWKPRRTIVLCSWDAEEFGMIGSTEWVEQNLINLGSKAVAYINVDCAVQGPGFFARATPQFDDILIEVTKKVMDPDSEGVILYEGWTRSNGGVNIQRLSGVDSDYAPFLQLVGVPCADLYYGKDFPVYHTAFDSYSWMKQYGDPLFQRHVSVSGVWGLLALHLADDTVLPFNYLSYAAQLQEHVNILRKSLEANVSLDPLVASIGNLASAAKEANDEAKKLMEQEDSDELSILKRQAFNDRLMLAERGFLDVDGLKRGKRFKHLVYGPTSNYESKLDFFPGVADAISQSKSIDRRERQAAIQHEIWRVARAVNNAAKALRGQLL
ncbi:Peptidase M28 [Dillenia turbinata]|uniref:glutamate carboxypeptidase II n=1 Tax=Dillenia turbinata TaxID=194707 RepID=A0AAN8ZII1_9MAGN